MDVRSDGLLRYARNDGRAAADPSVSGKHGEGAQEKVRGAEIAGFEGQRQGWLGGFRGRLTVQGTPGLIPRPTRRPSTSSAWTTAPAVPPRGRRPPHPPPTRPLAIRAMMPSTKAPARSRPEPLLHQGNLVWRCARRNQDRLPAEQRLRPGQHLPRRIAWLGAGERVDRKGGRAFLHMGPPGPGSRSSTSPTIPPPRRRSPAIRQPRFLGRAGPDGGNSRAGRSAIPEPPVISLKSAAASPIASRSRSTMASTITWAKPSARIRPIAAPIAAVPRPTIAAGTSPTGRLWRCNTRTRRRVPHWRQRVVAHPGFGQQHVADEQIAPIDRSPRFGKGRAIEREIGAECRDQRLGDRADIAGIGRIEGRAVFEQDLPHPGALQPGQRGDASLIACAAGTVRLFSATTTASASGAAVPGPGTPISCTVRMPRRTRVLHKSVAPVKSSAIAPSSTVTSGLPCVRQRPGKD